MNVVHRGRQKVDKLEVGLVLGLTFVLVFILVVGYSPSLEELWRVEIDIREEIGKLRTHHGDNYSIREDNWVQWESQMRDAGGNFTRMGTWEEFKASLESSDVTFLMLDEENRVVWYNPPFTNQVIYFEY